MTLLFGSSHQCHVLIPGVRIVLGRSKECDIVVEHDSVSRQHLELCVRDELVLKDLGSRNGTCVGGRALKGGEEILAPLGSLIEMGSVTVVVQQGRVTSTPSDVSPPSSVTDLVAAVAPSTISVIVRGETGAGKEMIAEAIHTESSRKSGPLLKLNCAALPESLLESELFGYERGAFSGAQQAKPGLLEAADTGTLFLDEVGDLPLPTQAKVLRVLESGEVLRLGSLKARKVDVRFVAATHRDLERMVEEGAFREDLYFRLSGICIEVPPLRERKREDPGAGGAVSPKAVRSARAPGAPAQRERTRRATRAPLARQRAGAEERHRAFGAPVPCADPRCGRAPVRVEAFPASRFVELRPGRGGHRSRRAPTDPRRSGTLRWQPDSSGEGARDLPGHARRSLGAVRNCTPPEVTSPSQSVNTEGWKPEFDAADLAQQLELR